LILLSYLQIFIGSSKSVFSQSFSTFAKWVDYNWLTSLWQFTSQAKIVLDIEHKWLPQLPRENDAFIMDLALTYRFTPMQLKYINHCRLYLQVLTISEITDASGHHILTTATQGIKDSSRPSKYLWPHYPSPPRAVWQSWKIFLAHISRNAKLHQPLGSWRSPPHQEWHWYQSHSTAVYYHDYESSTCYIYAFLPRPKCSNRCMKFTYQHRTISTPPLLSSLMLTTVSPHKPDQKFFSLSGIYYASFPTPDPPHASLWPDNLPDIWRDIPPYFQHIIGPSPPSLAECQEIKTIIKQDSLVTRSDGAHDKFLAKSSHAWVFGDNLGSLLAAGAGPTDGHPALLSAYRTEHSCLLGLLYTSYIGYAIIMTYTIIT